jgi:hypothetical protein
MILEGSSLTIEPSYPLAQKIMEASQEPTQQVGTSDQKIRNVFWSWRYRVDVAVWEEEGRIEWGLLSVGNRSGLELETLCASEAWGIEQESAAIRAMGTLLSHRQFKQYLLTGMFLERSKRSGVHYLFRKLRPTIALSGTRRCGAAWQYGDDPMRILCALCLHPIGYYQQSWAGAMTPTDDVLAHLMLMRGDETLFWRRANQHPPYRREAGI